MKAFARRIVVSILGWQVRRLQRAHDFKVVAVVGSVGKTSTKMAIAQALGSFKRVRYQAGNYNDLVSVPLIFFGLDMPSLVNPISWVRVFLHAERQIRSDYPYDIVVVELGTDGPGQIKQFKRYLRADIAFITAVAPEHMEFFEDLDAVAKEELSVVQFSDQVVLNADLVAAEYQSLIPEAVTYGINSPADFMAKSVVFTTSGVKFAVNTGDKDIKLTHQSFALPQVYSLIAALLVATEFGTAPTELQSVINTVVSPAGRLNKLGGIQNSTIIDDSYNASPEAMRFALDILYRLKASQKIALLGNMNELGKTSAQAHKELGTYCNPEQIDELITLGPHANKYLAKAARQNGCKVTAFKNPYDAGEYIKSVIKPGALVLVKGSQNKVYAEEAIKPLLADSSDEAKLVRQSPSWLAKKTDNFA